MSDVNMFVPYSVEWNDFVSDDPVGGRGGADSAPKRKPVEREARTSERLGVLHAKPSLLHECRVEYWLAFLRFYECNGDRTHD